MKRAGNVGNARQHLHLIRVIAGADDRTNGDGCERCTRRTSPFRHSGGIAGRNASRADRASGIDPRVVGTRQFFRRRSRMDALVPRRLGRRGARVHALRQHDGNPVGQHIRRCLTRRRGFNAAFDGAGRHSGSVSAARRRLRKFEIFSHCERRAALIAPIDGDVIHRLAFRTGLEVERRAALIAELRSCGIAVDTEVTACG
ncbi:MAG TPA: hypothetical protein VFO53_08720 [Casimicrobiaceae bacterium]|nr:hypothetical protein [Casimicrobiaceae bacterium]